jgi:hypothetical protein
VINQQMSRRIIQLKMVIIVCYVYYIKKHNVSKSIEFDRFRNEPYPHVHVAFRSHRKK